MANSFPTVEQLPPMSYYPLLKQIHELLQPRTYVELGVREGTSLALAGESTLAIGIDPNPILQAPARANTRIFTMTSDEFFAKYDLRALLEGNPVDLAFIDGMHLFEFALRDFINLEKHCGPASVILVHDCYPIDVQTSARERVTQVWSGDVWKLVLCLKKNRPDLRLATVDVSPTGLLIVRNLAPDSTELSDRLPQLYEEYTKLGFEVIKADKARQLNYLENEWSQIQPALLLAGGQARRKPRALGVLLCHNDADILPEAIEHLLANNHDVAVWDHGSTDNTAAVLDRYQNQFVQRQFIPRDFDFYKVYPVVSEHLLRNYVHRYDWISWPDQDEFLEGPCRDKTYYVYVTEVFHSGYDWLQFRNFNYWFTEEDDPAVISPVQRIRRYCCFPDCAPRVRAWRASATNERIFNHNPPRGRRYPVLFNLRHYPMRSPEHMIRRITKDRAGLQRGTSNVHYNAMARQLEKLRIAPEQLHRDDGREDLNSEVIFSWRDIYYGSVPLATEAGPPRGAIKRLLALTTNGLRKGYRILARNGPNSARKRAS